MVVIQDGSQIPMYGMADIREITGLSQEEVAAQIGCCRPFLSQVETGKTGKKGRPELSSSQNHAMSELLRKLGYRPELQDGNSTAQALYSNPYVSDQEAKRRLDALRVSYDPNACLCPDYRTYMAQGGPKKGRFNGILIFRPEID